MAGICLYAVGLVIVVAGGIAHAASGFLLPGRHLRAVWAVSGFNLGYECSDEPDPARVYAGVSLVSAPLRIIGPPARALQWISGAMSLSSSARPASLSWRFCSWPCCQSEKWSKRAWEEESP